MAMLLAAAVVLAAQVQVRSGPAALSCGSAWDVMAGRAGWSEWWSADLDDPAQVGQPPARTVLCPAAVNRRTLGAGGLSLVATVVVAAGALVERRRRPVAPAAQRSDLRRLRAFGIGLTVLGSASAIGGVAGLILLLADPGAAVFLYVDRFTVALAGLLLLLPAVLLVALGRAAMLLADHRASETSGHAAP